MADLDNDGHAEVIFTSWPKSHGPRQAAHVLNYLGSELYRPDLPPRPNAGWNGGLAPDVRNIDADGTQAGGGGGGGASSPTHPGLWARGSLRNRPGRSRAARYPP